METDHRAQLSSPTVGSPSGPRVVLPLVGGAARATLAFGQTTTNRSPLSAISPRWVARYASDGESCETARATGSRAPSEDASAISAVPQRREEKEDGTHGALA